MTFISEDFSYCNISELKISSFLNDIPNWGDFYFDNKFKDPVFLCLLFVPCLQAKELPTFKDNDFLNEGHKLQIGDDNKKYFLEKLKRDVEVVNIQFSSSLQEN